MQRLLHKTNGFFDRQMVIVFFEVRYLKSNDGQLIHEMNECGMWYTFLPKTVEEKNKMTIRLIFFTRNDMMKCP